MADLQRLLGGMLASGMGGRSRRGPAFAASPFMGSRGSSFGSFQKTAGLGALAYLGYKAYQEYQKNSGGTAAGQTPSTGRAPSTGQAPARGGQSAGSGGPSLGERLGSMLGINQGKEKEPEPATLDDRHALLLIRAMIAAANADGEISPEERQTISSRVDAAGAGPEERAVLQQELQNPRSVDQIAREVTDQETAEEVYLASRIAMNPDTPAEKAYLDYLASRLNIPSERVAELNAAA